MSQIKKEVKIKRSGRYFPSARDFSPTGDYHNLDKEAYVRAIQNWLGNNKK